MKSIFLLPLSFLFLTACDVADKALAPVVAPLLKDQEIVVEGPSGFVTIRMAASDIEELSMPSQISISFEKQSAETEKVSLEKIEGLFMTLLNSKNDETQYFGCDGQETETELPQKIDAAKVVLCGKIKVSAVNFKLRASELELRDVELIATAPFQKILDLSKVPVLDIYTAHLTLVGANKTILQGFDNGRERDFSPILIMNLGKVDGTGNLEIFSRSYIKTHKM